MEPTKGNSFILDHVFSDKDAFIIAVARMHAILNVAQEHLLTDPHMPTISAAWNACISAHCDGMSETEAERCCEGERKSWMSDARKQVTAVMKANMPWTLRSADTFWPLPAKKAK